MNVCAKTVAIELLWPQSNRTELQSYRATEKQKCQLLLVTIAAKHRARQHRIAPELVWMDGLELN